MKKISRKRLYDVEKQGIDVDIDIGTAMKNALVSATQHRLGNKLITDIVLDLGTSKGAITTGGTTAARAIGEASGTARVCKLSESVFGVVTEIRTVCLEAITSDGTAMANSLDVISGSDGGAAAGALDSGSGGILAGTLVDIGSAVANDEVIPIDNNAFSGKYLYLGTGASPGSAQAATADISNLTAAEAAKTETGSYFSLRDAAGKEHIFVIDNSHAHDGTAMDNVIGLGNSPSNSEVEAEVAQIINANSSFTAAAQGGGVVRVTQGTAGPSGNQTVIIADQGGTANAYNKLSSGDTSTFAIADFAGGTTPGLTILNKNATYTGGKFLIRVTGFVVPADL